MTQGASAQGVTPDAEGARSGVADAAVRKTVTALFTDLSGSTGFGERVDAETARTVMARYHTLLAEVISSNGGTVAKFIGDGMMALFGVPDVAEDDAERAVRAGAALQARFVPFAAEVADRHDEVLSLRVGINTGEIVIGDGDADLVGDALNVAARLEAACPLGGVVVGPETWRLTRAAFGFESLGALTVKGRAEPVGPTSSPMALTSRRTQRRRSSGAMEISNGCVRSSRTQPRTAGPAWSR